jgi:hypothetical protein
LTKGTILLIVSLRAGYEGSTIHARPLAEN